MTAYELTQIKLIIAVLEKWANGPERKKYRLSTRTADRERLKELKEILKANETPHKQTRTTGKEVPEG